MKTADRHILESLDRQAEERKREIRSSPDRLIISGRTYYVSNGGNDMNDGLSEETPWQSLGRVSSASLEAGDGVLFRRGDLFRGCISAHEGVTYGAYGVGEKPRFYGWEKSLADPALWEPYGDSGNIWHLTEPILDCGTLVFDGGEAHCRKLIPSYINSRFVRRDDEGVEFVIENDLERDLDMVTLYSHRLTEKPSHGESFPVPVIDDDSLGDLYLRCDGINPALRFSEIEALPRRNMFKSGSHANVHIDNLCLKYIGAHAIGAGGECVRGLKVTNCELGWIGGGIQNYLGVDPNYPEGGRGSVTRYGNGIEIYGGCLDYLVEGCYIYQVYDAAITHQITTRGKSFKLSNIRYTQNLVEYCVYSIEYFLEKTMGDCESAIEGCEIEGNILRFSGFGWGQQRHNTHTPAHIKGWSYENTARDFTVKNNIFDRAAYRMLHLVAREQSSCPAMEGNTYVQYEGGSLGQYGANACGEPEDLTFDRSAEEKIKHILGDTNPEVYIVK